MMSYASTVPPLEFVEDPIVAQIEDIFLDILRQLLPTESERAASNLSPDAPSFSPVLYLPAANTASNVIFDFNTETYSVSDSQRTRSWSLTSTTALAYTRLLTVLATAHTLGKSRTTMTKRALFYSDVAIFRDQAASDKSLDDAVRLLALPRHALAITNARKGAAVAGVDISFQFKGSSTESFTAGSVFHVPQFPETITGVAVSAPIGWVLVVEKEAVFSRLTEDGTANGYPASCVGPGIIVTGRGYPDVATRALLRTISATFPSAPILALVDCDPHGYQIAAVYAHGSLARASEAPHLALPNLQLLGVRPGDRELVASPARLPMSPANSHLASCLLLREPFLSLRPSWRADIQQMIDRNEVFETEGIYTSGLTYLANNYLPTRIQQALINAEEV